MQEKAKQFALISFTYVDQDVKLISSIRTTEKMHAYPQLESVPYCHSHHEMNF